MLVDPATGITLLRVILGVFWLVDGSFRVRSEWRKKGSHMRELIERMKSPPFYRRFLNNVVLAHYSFFRGLIYSTMISSGLLLLMGALLASPVLVIIPSLLTLILCANLVIRRPAHPASERLSQLVLLLQLLVLLTA